MDKILIVNVCIFFYEKLYIQLFLSKIIDKITISFIFM